MNVQPLQINKLVSERLTLIPFTKQICNNIINENYSDLAILELTKGKGWPDDDILETLPKIIVNLTRVELPTGFESWMIIKKGSREIIGDIGFKGFNYYKASIDIGYGIIKEERRNGYASEAVDAIINWAFSNKIVKEITARCLLNNHVSSNLLHKFNFKQIRQDDTMIYWSLTRMKPVM